MIARKLIQPGSRAAVLQDADVSEHRAARGRALDPFGHLVVVARERRQESR